MEESKKGSVLRTAANILSLVAHPVFLPVYGLLIIFNAPTFMVHLPASLKRIIFMLATINMTVVPMAFLPLLKYRKLIDSYQMDSRKERIIPLAMGTMMYIVTTIIFFSYEIPQLIKLFMMASSVLSFLLLVITFWWKISIHAAGIGALLASVLVLSLRMMADLTPILMGLLILSGVLLSSRLFLKAHKPVQVYSGFLLGLFSMFIVMMIF